MPKKGQKIKPHVSMGLTLGHVTSIPDKGLRVCTTEEYLNADVILSDFLTHFRQIPLPEHFPFTIKLPKRYCLEKGCIIDLETTSIDPWSGYMITMGILEKDKAVVHQLTVPKYKDFRVFCFQKARETQEPRHSYNARFESKFLRIEKWIDLMQYKTLDLFRVCERGLEIAKEKESQVKQIDNCNYKVHSQRSDEWYTVYHSGNDWSCECNFFQSYLEKCKHIWAVEFSFKGLEMEQVKREEMILECRKSLGKCTSSVFEEPPIRGGNVPQIWEQWLNTNKPEILALITLHCLSDLLRERQLIKDGDSCGKESSYGKLCCWCLKENPYGNNFCFWCGKNISEAYYGNFTEILLGRS